MGKLLFVAIFASALPAWAQNFNSETFRPSAHSDGFFSVESGAIAPSLNVQASLFFDYEYRPLVLYAPNGLRLSSPLEHRFSAQVTGAVSLFDRLSIGIYVPVDLYQTDDPKTAQDGVKAPQNTAFGDIRLEPKIGILNQRRHHIDLAILLDVTLPSSSRHAFAGDSDVSFGGELDISRRWGAFRLAGNFGYQWRNQQEYYDLTIGQELYYRVGAGFDLGRIVAKAPLEFIGEIFGQTYAPKAFSGVADNPMEWVLGVRYSPVKWLQLNLGGGRAILSGYGAPAARGFLGATFIPLAQTKDESGDRDHDGIPDYLDKCPDQPEDYDGFQDDDGCPDPDNDGDGIPDVKDKCPNEPEDFDGFQDDDGCPDLDNDNDGVPDTKDNCPNTPGPASNGGCPVTDSDGDGVPDAIDKCPNKPGPASAGGCPVMDIDTDHDGIPDALDKCPTQPETINGIDDFDGCPDQGPSLIVITKTNIEIKEQVFFESGTDRIKSKSYNLLNQVAAALINHATITKLRVEGHTDDVGNDAANMKLSQHRADAVRRYLITQGVAPDRLAAVGYGETKPIASNETKKGRELNRRVAFTILDGNAPPAPVVPLRKPESKKTELKKAEPVKAEIVKKPEPKKVRAEKAKREPKGKTEPKTIRGKSGKPASDDIPLVTPKTHKADDIPLVTPKQKKKKGVNP